MCHGHTRVSTEGRENNNNGSLTTWDNAYTKMWQKRGSGWAGNFESFPEEDLVYVAEKKQWLG